MDPRTKEVDRFFLDTEFIEDGKTMNLISIALVPEQKAMVVPFYKCNLDCNIGLASDWVRRNVLPHLPLFSSPHWDSKAAIVAELIQFITNNHNPEHGLEIWGYFADYDWVGFCQLFGKMIDLPVGWPMFCMDLKQEMVERGFTKDQLPPQPKNAHDAVADAMWIRTAFEFISSASTETPPNKEPLTPLVTASPELERQRIEREGAFILEQEGWLITSVAHGSTSPRLTWFSDRYAEWRGKVSDFRTQYPGQWPEPPDNS